MTLEQLLTRLKRRLSIADTAQDALLTDLLADANALMLSYMNRDTMPEALYPVQTLLASMLYNRLGMEGEGSRSEGEVTMTVDTLPREITSALQTYRRAGSVTL